MKNSAKTNALTALGLLLALGTAVTAQPAHDGGAAVLAPATTLASWPPGTFIESIAVLPDGTIYVINHGARSIDRVLNGVVESFSRLPAQGTGLLARSDGGFLVTARTESGSEIILSVTSDGKAETLAELPGAGFLNGMTWLSPGIALAADSAAGTIWRIDAATGAVGPWLVHPLLGPADVALTFPDHTAFPAANGIKRHGDHIYVSNSGRAQILRIPISGDGSAGVPDIWADRIIGDDFVLDALGTIYVPTHPMQSLVKIEAGGRRSTIATSAQGLAGPTAAAFGPDGRLLIVGNSAIPIDGVQRPATLVSLSVTEAHGLQQIEPMVLFLVTAPTRSGSDAAREAHGQAYRRFLQENIERIAIGGQIKDAADAVVERVYLVTAESETEAVALMERSPYYREGIYGPLAARRFQGMLGDLIGGVAWSPL